MRPFPQALLLLQYVFLRAGLAAVQSLGFSRAMRLARECADLASRFDRRRRGRALENLAAAFPELSEGEREKIARDSFRSFLYAYVELVYLGRIVRASNVHEHFTADFHPAARAAVEAGRGVVFVTGHLGNWEVTGSLLPYEGIRLVSVARTIENPWIDRYLSEVRERTGQEIVAREGALRSLSRALREGRCLGILTDQNAGKQGIFVEFFGRPASTVSAPATLALKFGAPMIPAYQRRLGLDFRHRLVVDSPIAPPETGDRSKDVWIMTQEMTRRFEEWVRAEPGQWPWSHRRWKKQPGAGEEWRPDLPAPTKRAKRDRPNG